MQVWQDAYMRLEIDHERRLVRQTRSAQVYEDIALMEQSFEAMNAQLFGLDRGAYGLLQDVRAVRGRNDPRFEDAIKRARTRMTAGFRRVAVLVATQVGLMQVQRLELSSPSPAHAFVDEAEALRWLLQP